METIMDDEQHRFLRLLGQLPARLTAEQAAWVVNCQPHDIPVLMAAGLLRPLANPAANRTKYFATVDLLERVKDRNWLARVTGAIGEYWQGKNARKQGTATDSDRCRAGEGSIPTLSFSPAEKGAQR